MDAQFRVHADVVGVGEDHARRTQTGQDPAGPDDAGAHSAAGVVGPAADDGRAGLQSHVRGHLLRHAAADVDGFESGRQELRGQAYGVQHGAGPATVPYVKQQGTRGVGDFHGEFAGHAEPDVVLGQQNLLDAVIDIRFVVADPDQLGRGEAFEGRIGHPVHQVLFASLFRDPAALIGRPRIAPQDGRPEHLVPFIQQDRTVHLARQADPGDGFGRHAGGAHGFAHCVRRRAPPVRRILFGPVGTGRVQGDLLEGPGRQAAPFVDDDRLDPRGADVDADQVSHGWIVACLYRAIPAQKNLRNSAGTRRLGLEAGFNSCKRAAGRCGTYGAIAGSPVP